jgi:hypothetical protein
MGNFLLKSFSDKLWRHLKAAVQRLRSGVRVTSALTGRRLFLLKN